MSVAIINEFNVKKFDFCGKIDINLEFQSQKYVMFFWHFILFITKVKFFERNHRSQPNSFLEKWQKMSANA